MAATRPLVLLLGVGPVPQDGFFSNEKLSKNSAL
jgi:hypothetical protein